MPKLTGVEIKYLKEFVWVMEPVAVALDILQKDKNMFMGYLLPTVQSLENQLRFRKEKEGRPLKFCDTLVKVLLNAIRKPRRFQHYVKDEELIIAACLIPRFKFNWIEDQSVKSDYKAKILKEMGNLLPTEDWCSAGMYILNCRLHFNFLVLNPISCSLK